MSNTKTRINVQIQKIDEMITVLEQSCTYMEFCLKEAEKAIEARIAQGLPEDKAKDYKDDHWSKAKVHVTKTIEGIRTAHIPYLKNVKGHLMRALGR